MLPLPNPTPKLGLECRDNQLSDPKSYGFDTNIVGFRSFFHVTLSYPLSYECRGTSYLHSVFLQFVSHMYRYLVLSIVFHFFCISHLPNSTPKFGLKYHLTINLVIPKTVNSTLISVVCFSCHSFPPPPSPL